jgi:hypothetical protein
MVEEFCEVLAEPEEAVNWTPLRKELVQLAAVCVQAIEAGDRHHGMPPEEG